MKFVCRTTANFVKHKFEIDVKYLGVALRAVGLIISEKETDDFIRKFSKDNSSHNRIDLGSFLVIVADSFQWNFCRVILVGWIKSEDGLLLFCGFVLTCLIFISRYT